MGADVRTPDATEECPRDGFWDLYSGFYDSIYHLMPYRKLLWDAYESLQLLPGMRVLDAGCGTGNFELFLDEKNPPAVEIEAIDFSPGMLSVAGRKCEQLAGVTFRQADLDAELPFDDASFDRIVSINVLYALPDPDKTLREFTRVLKPGGVLVITSPSPTFRIRPLVVDHFQRLANVWGLRRKAFKALDSVWALLTGGLAQIVLSVFVIDRRESAGHYCSLDDAGLRDLLGRQSKHGLGRFDIGSALASQNTFATAVKVAA